MTGTSWTIAEYDADAPMLAGPIPAALPAVPIVALPPIAENMQGGVAIEEIEPEEVDRARQPTDAVAIISALGLEPIDEEARQAAIVDEAAEAEKNEAPITETMAAHAENKDEVPITETMAADEAAMAKTGTDDNA